MERNPHLDSFEVASALRNLNEARSKFLDDVYMFGVATRNAWTHIDRRESKAAQNRLKSLDTQCQKLKADMLAKESARYEARRAKEQKLSEEKSSRHHTTIYIYNDEVRNRKRAAIESSSFDKHVKFLCADYKKEQTMFENASAKVKELEIKLQALLSA